jgi:hypothetical protein
MFVWSWFLEYSYQQLEIHATNYIILIFIFIGDNRFNIVTDWPHDKPPQLHEVLMDSLG